VRLELTIWLVILIHHLLLLLLLLLRGRLSGLGARGVCAVGCACLVEGALVGAIGGAEFVAVEEEGSCCV
jgi:hypothetical protein